MHYFNFTNNVFLNDWLAMVNVKVCLSKYQDKYIFILTLEKSSYHKNQ